MKFLTIGLLIVLPFTCVLTFSSEDAMKGQCLQPEQCFRDMMDEIGIDYAVKYAINSDMDFTQELLKHSEKTEPIIRNIINNPSNFDPRTVGCACWTSYKMGLNGLIDPIEKLAFSDEKDIKFLACQTYVRICPPDRFPVILQLMETDITDIKSPLLRFARDRKIVDPDLLEKWRDEQLEKDKNRNTKVMADWFLKKVNDAIQTAKEEKRTPDLPTVDPTEQKDMTK